MSRLKKALLVSLVVAAIGALGAGGTLLGYLQQTLPQTSGRLAAPGLEAPVQIIRDRWGVPHIYAHSEDDLFFAQGYVQAQDRLWQMEVSRRAAYGTLAEVLGVRALASDHLARVMGFGRGLDAELEALDPEARQVLGAYTRGVNALLAAPERRLPIEFAMLGYSPAPWQPQDVLAWARLFAWSQSVGWEAEHLNARLMNAVGPERTAQLLGSPELPLFVPGLAQDLAAAIQPLLLEGPAGHWSWFTSPGNGGHGWVTLAMETGRPILASAPSTPVQMPSLWYTMHLVGGRYDVIGATVPGLPAVVMGRNRSIAWGMNGAAIDSMDLYLERVRPGTPPQVEFRGAWEDLQVREEEILVRGQDAAVRITVYTSRHGPLVSSLDSGALQVALRWVGAERPPALVQCLPNLNRAEDWGQFQSALRSWTVPAQVLVFADTNGRVGFATAAAVPQRTGGDGRLPVPGWTGDHEWGDFSTSDVLPHGLRPADDTLIVAAGSVTPEGWPARSWEEVWASRMARRIAGLMAAYQSLTIEDVQTIQCDDGAPGEPLLALLLALAPQGWIQERTMPYLQRWDLSYDAESAGAGIFEAIHWRFVHSTLGDELGPELVDSYLGVHPSHRMVIEAFTRQPDSLWFDDQRTPQREGRDEILARSFAEGIRWLGRRFGDLPYEWNWGRVHSVTFRHALGHTWPQGLLLNRGPMRLGGAPDCANATGPHYGRRMEVQTALSYRMVVDLSEGGKTWVVNSSGQSGNPLSRHYADMTEPWREGRYHPLLYDREDIERAKGVVLTLTP